LTKKLDVKRLCLVGATGLVGRSVIEHAVNRWDIRIVAVARREMPLPKGSRMEMLVADPSPGRMQLPRQMPGCSSARWARRCASLAGTERYFALSITTL